jgi:hypothetical protein
VFAQGVMPKLQRLKLSFDPRKRNSGGFDVCLENLTSLEHVTIELINCNRLKLSTSIEYFPATTAGTSDYPQQMCETTKWDWESNVP